LFAIFISINLDTTGTEAPKLFRQIRQKSRSMLRKLTDWQMISESWTIPKLGVNCKIIFKCYIFSCCFLYRQQRQTTARKLCHDTERFLKDLKDLHQNDPPETPVSYAHALQT